MNKLLDATDIVLIGLVIIISGKAWKKLLIAIIWIIFIGCLATAIAVISYAHFYDRSDLFLFSLFFSSSVLSYMGYLTLRLHYRKPVNLAD